MKAHPRKKNEDQSRSQSEARSIIKDLLMKITSSICGQLVKLLVQTYILNDGE